MGSLPVPKDDCIGAGFLKRYHIAKKWWWFIGVLAYFAYHYLRPFIRSRLGSASQ